jgi:hypothetical protein
MSKDIFIADQEEIYLKMLKNKRDGRFHPVCYIVIEKVGLRFYFGYDCTESMCIAYRQVCQHLAVEGNPSRFHAKNQSTVADAVLAGCSIDPCNPQFSQVAFTNSPVACGVPQAFQHGFICTPEEQVPAAEITFVHL